MSEKTVTISAINPKSIPSMVGVTPVFDRNKGVFPIGNKTYAGTPVRDRNGEVTHYESVDAPLPLSTSVARPFKHGQQFDRANPQDELLLQMLIDQDILCPEGQRANPQQHRFFMKDRMADAQRQVDRGTLMSRALMAVNQLTEDEKLNIAFVEKQPVRTMTSLEVSGFVFGLVQTNPKRILELIEDKTFKVRAFIQKLVSYGIISISSSGVKHGNDVIALDEDNAVAWMSHVDNKGKVMMFREELDRRAGTSGTSPRAAAEAAENGGSATENDPKK